VTEPGRPRRSPLRHGWVAAGALRRPVLFVNPRSGGGKAERAGVADHARARGVEVVVLGPGSDLRALAEEAVAGGADALGVAGGDGSLGLVAAVASARGLPFVCIPAGTRNHFALDLGVDRRDLVGALDAFTDGVERRIDVARVGSRLFLDNVSLGVYGDAVQRAEYRDAKARTLLETAREVLGPGGAAAGLRLVDDRGTEHRDPAVVILSNNPYAVHRPVVTATRPSLTSGQLGVLVVDRPEASRDSEGQGHRLGHGPVRAWTATSLRVDGPEPLHAGVDGEAVDLHPPIEVVIEPAALQVRISSRHPGVSPSSLVSS
jgi:diacylglycerol kinase family enzyme